VLWAVAPCYHSWPSPGTLTAYSPEVYRAFSPGIPGREQPGHEANHVMLRLRLYFHSPFMVSCCGA